MVVGGRWHSVFGRPGDRERNKTSVMCWQGSPVGLIGESWGLVDGVNRPGAQEALNDKPCKPELEFSPTKTMLYQPMVLSYRGAVQK